MTDNAFPHFPEVSSGLQKDPATLNFHIRKAYEWAHKNKKARIGITDPGAAFIILMSYLLTDTPWWEDHFIKAQRAAATLYRDPGTYWRTIATELATSKVKDIYHYACGQPEIAKYHPWTIEPIPQHGVYTDPTPNPVKETQAPEIRSYGTKQKRQALPATKQPPKKGELWKLDPRWDHLWESSRKIFPELLRRAQYPKRQDAWPWCQPGLKSLRKFTGISKRQAIRALKQLQNHGLIHQIVHGNQRRGCSKYRIFLTPEMSGAFTTTIMRRPPKTTPRRRPSKTSL